MKAILIKYLGVTATKSTRFKLSVHGQKSKTYSADSCYQDNSADSLELLAAKRYLKDVGLSHLLDRHGLTSGQLPNGDFVAVFTNKG